MDEREQDEASDALVAWLASMARGDFLFLMVEARSEVRHRWNWMCRRGGVAGAQRMFLVEDDRIPPPPYTECQV